MNKRYVDLSFLWTEINFCILEKCIRFYAEWRIEFINLFESLKFFPGDVRKFRIRLPCFRSNISDGVQTSKAEKYLSLGSIAFSCTLCAEKLFFLTY